VQKLAIAGVTLPLKGKGYKEIIMKYKTKNQGFSLIEVMIAVLVLGVGILAVAKLQSTLMRSGSDANQRTVATSLAQVKIDDLRAFTKRNNSTYETWAEAIALLPNKELLKTQLAYSHISSNTGGFPTATLIESIPILANYSLSWTVQDYWHTTALADPVTTEPAPAPATSDFKKITVTVGWNNETGDPQSVALDTLITAYPPALTNLSNNSQHGGEPIKVKYTPGLAPDVIKVDLGDGQFKEATKALPDVSHDGENTLVTFSAVTFTTDGDGNSTADRIDEYSTVNCNCTFSGTGNGYTPSGFAWNNTTKEIYDKKGELVNKTTATEDNNGSGTETLLAHVCTQCCRDHHDSDDSSVKYVAGTAASGNHAHYDSLGGALVVENSGNNYVETCRLKNIDGIRRTFQDWQLKTTITSPNSYLADAGTQADYQDYVTGYISDYTENNGDSPPLKLTSRDVDSLPKGGNEQLSVRAIYIDEVEQEGSEYENCISGIVDPDHACYGLNSVKITPFVEINLTKLANWTSSYCTDDGGAGACVSNDAIVDEGLSENNYSRGLVTASGTATLSAVANISASINAGNSGVIGGITSGTPIVDSVTATITAAIDTFSITGNIALCNTVAGGVKGSFLDAAVATYSGSSNGSCDISTNGNNSRTMTCDNIPSLSADITIAIPNTSPIASVTFTNNDHTNITGPVDIIEVVLCDQ